MKDIREKALSYLNKDYKLNIDMIEAIRRQVANIVLCEDNGVLAKTKEEEGCYLLSCEGEEFALKAAQTAKGVDIMCVHQRDNVELLCKSLGLEVFMECVNAIYSGEVTPPCGEWDIRPLDISYARQVGQVYRGEFEYVEQLIKRGMMFGCFVDGKLAGFVGNHMEGSCGLLEVLPEYRRRGIGQALECFIFERELKQGHVPYGQVVVGNEKSMSLQKKLSMVFSDSSVFWMSKK